MSTPSQPGRDHLLVPEIRGEARHHAARRELTADEHAAAVAALRELAGGRADLLAEVAGLTEGLAEGQPDGSRPGSRRLRMRQPSTVGPAIRANPPLAANPPRPAVPPGPCLPWRSCPEA